ncbi:ferredoxin family protein [Streptomyces sp. NPDC052693]|uniref:4Fe-4S dicluster domain-containing protein n=1 Tax=Streptomyces sp. NPDC052693 TaxID=3155814 RepID=UPI003415146F
MTYVITSACVETKDGACAAVCPVDCIHPTEGESGYGEATQLYINPDECIECDACVGACPVGAPYAEENLPPELAHFKQINADWFAAG